MKAVNSLLDMCRRFVRGIMRSVARVLNKLTGGRLSPNFVTIFGLLMHIPIALMIAQGYLGYAAVGLVVFGLFDTLDGELARLQKRASTAGMLLDAVTDRMKEVLLYMGIGYYFIRAHYSFAYEYLPEPETLTAPMLVAITIAAAGGSLLVSYVKAKSETAVAGQGLSANEVNRLFQDGLMRFELRMAVLVVGLICGINGLVSAVIVIAVLSWLTALGRLIKISRELT